jgi:ribulose-phosphate 3-epimerase
MVAPIIPAIIPTSADALATALSDLAGLPEVHLDVVDGQFVPAISWPYSPIGDPLAFKPLLDTFSLEVDLMVSDPLGAASAWCKAGADQLIFHIETITPDALAAFADAHAITIGISAHMATPNDRLLAYVDHADYLQVMGIAQIGSQGQPFDRRAFDRIAWARQQAPQLALSIDGSVNHDTLPQLAALALDRYIVGSAIIKQPSPKQAYASLVALWQSTVTESNQS